MPENFLTRCPDCSTLFTLTSDQLKLAEGNVRCGSCLSIFNARLYLTNSDATNKEQPMALKSDSTASNSATTPNSPKTVRDSNWITALSDDIEQSYQELSDSLEHHSLNNKEALAAELEQLSKNAMLTANTKTSANSKKSTAHATTSQEKKPQRQPDATVSATGPEKLWSQNILQELENQSRNIASNIQEAIRAQYQEGEASDSEASAPIPTLKDLELLPLRDETAIEPPDQQQTQTSKTKPPYKKANTPQAVKPKKQTKKNKSKKANKSQTPNKQTNQKSYNSLALDELDSLTLQELEGKALTQPRKWSLPVWSALSLISILTLVGQYSYFNFEQLSTTARFRPIARFTCLWVGCDLPVFTQLSALKSTHLVIRQHPTLKNHLSVDLKLVNKARFPQAFPDLELRFTDINDKVAAVRRFSPSEYRSKTLKSLALIPTNQPLHINLDIKDPGKSAINYHLNLKLSQEK